MMRIGFVYDLRSDWMALGYSAEETAEFDSEITINAIDAALSAAGHLVDRIGNARALMQRLAAGERWDLVFNIAEGLRGLGRESLVPCLLEDAGLPYTFSDPATIALTLHKAMAKHVVRDAGIPTADFALVKSMEDCANISLGWPLFAKPLAEGTGKGIDPRSKVHNQGELEACCARLLESYRQAVLVETYLPGREFTVGILGNGRSAKVLGVLEIGYTSKSDSDIYSYVNKEECESRIDYRLADDDEAAAAAKTAWDAYQALGIQDVGRVDVRMDAAGRACFIEVNPLPGLHPDHSDLPMLARMAGMSFQALIEGILSAAINRLSL